MLVIHFAEGDEGELEQLWHKQSRFWDEYQPGFRVSTAALIHDPDKVERALCALRQDSAEHYLAILAYYKARTRQRPLRALRALALLI